MRILGAALIALTSCLPAQAQMPPDLVEKLAALGRVIDPPKTNALYAPLHDGEPYPGATVIRDIKYRSMTEGAQAVFFLPVLQYFQPSMVLHVRAAGDPAAVLADLPRVVREIDPNVPFYNVGLMSGYTGAATFTQRLAANLLVVFGDNLNRAWEQIDREL